MTGKTTGQQLGALAGVLSRGVLTSAIYGMAHDPNVCEAVARAMYVAEMNQPWEKCSGPDRVVWRGRASFALLGLREYLRGRKA